MKSWAFELNALVALSLSGEEGEVIARSEAINCPDQFRVRYIAADGRQIEDWFFAEALKPSSTSKL